MRQPVLKSIFTVTPLPKGKLVTFAASKKVPEPEAGETPGSLRWIQRRIRPLHPETERTFFPTPMMVSVRCVSDDNLAGRLETWGSFAALASDIIEPQIVINETIVAKAMALVKGKTERWERVRAVTEYAQKQISYLAVTLGKDSLAGYRPHLPADVIKSGLGDCKDKAALTVALLRHLGEKAWVVLINSGDPRGVTPEWPSASFNHAIVAIAAGDDAPAGWPQVDGGVLGKLILFDATDPYVPLGVLPEADQGGYGIIVAKQTAGLAMLPTETPQENLLTRRISGKIDETGNIEAEVEVTRTGSSGAVDHYMRVNQGPEKFTHSLEAALHDAMPLIKNLKWKDDWNLTDARSQLNYSFVAENAAQHASSDMLLLCPRLIKRNFPHSPWKKDEDGLFWLPARGVHEEVTLCVPDGFTLGALPTAWQQTTPAATASISYHLSGQILSYEFDLRQQAGLFRQAEYETLRTFYRTVDEMDRRPVVMHRVRKEP
jgi:transglutaminase-like putative cysteine protease